MQIVPALAAIQISALEPGRRTLVVDCSGAFTCPPGSTLGDTLAAGALRADAVLADVAPAFGILKVGDITAALPATLEVNDVITGYLEKADFPWEDLELTTTGIQDYASVGATTAVHIDFRVTEPAGNPTDGRIRMMLPPGWRYVPGSTVVAPALPTRSVNRRSRPPRRRPCSCGT